MRKPIPGFDGFYEVDTEGNIYSLRSGTMLKPYKDKKGYLHYKLQINGTKYMILGHRAVAITFIPNPNNYPVINHKDENTGNNHVDNLEWCTNKYNQSYGTLSKRRSDAHKGLENNPGGRAVRKQVYQCDKDGTIIRFFTSISEAHRKTGINLSNIAQCCSGKRATAGKYKWKIKEEK